MLDHLICESEYPDAHTLYKFLANGVFFTCVVVNRAIDFNSKLVADGEEIYKKRSIVYCLRNLIPAICRLRSRCHS